MTVAETPTLNRASEPTPDREAKRKPVEAYAAGAQMPTVAFDLALEFARDALQARARQSGSASTAPAQMFEAAAQDTRGARQAELRADTQRETGTAGPDRFDATSVAARRESALASEQTAPSTGTDRSAVPRDGEDAVRHTPIPQRSVDAKAAKAEFVPGADGIETNAGRAARPQTPHESPSPVRASTQAPVTATGAGRVAPTAQPPTMTKGADGVAAKVGQVLGASRSGGTESARALQSAHAAPDGRPQTQARRRPETAPTAERSPHKAPPSRTQSGERAQAFDELIRSIRLRTGSHRSSAKMHLNPPELGRVSIDVHMDGDRLQVEVRTEHAEAAKLLHDRVAQLRAALAEQGIIVDRFDVGAESFATDGRSAAWDEAFEDHAGQQTSAREQELPGGVEAAGALDYEPDRSGLEMMAQKAGAERRLDVRI